MRYLAILSLLLLIGPAVAQERLPASDAYFACLVGKAAVEINYGANPDAAFETALGHCEEEAAESDKEPGGDMGSAAEAVQDAASAYVDRLVDR